METNEQAAREDAAVRWARMFHTAYEALAPKFGYETREETKKFNARSSNGKLMIAVMELLLSGIREESLTAERKRIKELEQYIESTKDLPASYEAALATERKRADEAERKLRIVEEALIYCENDK